MYPQSYRLSTRLRRFGAALLSYRSYIPSRVPGIAELVNQELPITRCMGFCLMEWGEIRSNLEVDYHNDAEAKNILIVGSTGLL